jgi:hypothetical protein
MGWQRRARAGACRRPLLSRALCAAGVRAAARVSQGRGGGAANWTGALAIWTADRKRAGGPLTRPPPAGALTGGWLHTIWDPPHPTRPP